MTGSFDLISIDPRDVFYLVAGLAFFGLTIIPRQTRFPFIAAPPLYIVAGALLALSPFALPTIDPRAGEFALTVVEHASELIVIVSLTGAGLAIDRAVGWRSWGVVWRQLAITMPLTICGIVALSVWLVGLPLASAILLAAALAPTDPVLARSVQVGGPTEGNETVVRLGLTGEAGLNDGLAFPFVYLAIALSGLSTASGASNWFTSWLAFDVAYRIAVGGAIGWAFGRYSAMLIYSAIGDAGAERGERGANAGLTMMAATFVCYGLTEALSGYGFLAVFVSAVAGRSFARGHEDRDPYVKNPHRFSEQFESLLLALLLLWFGGLIVSGLMNDLTWREAAIALILILVLRPLAGMIANIGLDACLPERAALAFYGIRGMGSVFYVAYGLSHGSFDEGDAIWRIAAVAITVSVLLHAISAPIVMPWVERARRKDEKARNADPELRRNTS